MKASLFSCVVAAFGCMAVDAATPYFTTGEMPNLIKCMPAPPAADSPAFAYDIVCYNWGKAQRNDPARASAAIRDAEWSLEALFTAFNESFGIALSKESTPEIWKLLEDSIVTVDQMRVEPKAYFHRKRPFALFNEPPLSPKDDAEWGNEGSYSE